MIGAKLAHPDKFCLNVMGDGAFGMSGLDLETAVRAGVAITTVLLNNGAMATYSGAQDAIGASARAAGVSTMGGNYAALAESLGARGIEVRTAVELHRALREAQRLNAAGTTVLIDVHANVESRRSRFQ
jgi:thiamine pyrophosphate-dependent acetolactate synthase large subunit-like protein